MVSLGSKVASGRTSEVFAYGEGSVVKVPRSGVPAGWARLEAEYTEAVRRRGVQAPEVRGMIEIDGRESIVFEHVHGPSMWEMMLLRPRDIEAFARELVAVHRSIQRAGLPDVVPDLVRRVENKIADVKQLGGDERAEAVRMIQSLPRGAALLHGDLHPGNVLMSKNGPIVIDWFDAAIGHPLADVVRASMLMRVPIEGDELAHLPNATPDLLERLLTTYLDGFADLVAHGASSLAAWEAVIAVSRRSEGLSTEEAGLTALWEGRGSATPSAQLAKAASRFSATGDE